MRGNQLRRIVIRIRTSAPYHTKAFRFPTAAPSATTPTSALTFVAAFASHAVSVSLLPLPTPSLSGDYGRGMILLILRLGFLSGRNDYWLICRLR